jgi:hypothetical protein
MTGGALKPEGLAYPLPAPTTSDNHQLQNNPRFDRRLLQPFHRLPQTLAVEHSPTFPSLARDSRRQSCGARFGVAKPERRQPNGTHFVVCASKLLSRGR